MENDFHAKVRRAYRTQDLSLPIDMLKAALADPRVDHVKLRELVRLMVGLYEKPDFMVREEPPDPTRARQISTWLDLTCAGPIGFTSDPEPAPRPLAGDVVVPFPTDTAKFIIAQGKLRRGESEQKK